MIVNLQEGLYPDFVGRRMIFAGSGGSLPSLYSRTTGDPVTLSNPRLYIDLAFSGMQTTDGTYYLQARPAGTGARSAWSYHWFVTATGAEVANGVSLSAESVVVGGFCGQF
jgi:hypothetical protein